MTIALDLAGAWIIASLAVTNAWAWFRHFQRHHANHSISVDLHGGPL